MRFFYDLDKEKITFDRLAFLTLKSHTCCLVVVLTFSLKISIFAQNFNYELIPLIPNNKTSQR